MLRQLEWAAIKPILQVIWGPGLAAADRGESLGRARPVGRIDRRKPVIWRISG